MRKTTRKIQNPNGETTRKPIELKYLLNYGIADLLNQSELNEYDLPVHYCDPCIYPDFIALNTEKSKYHVTSATALSFYTFDKTFDKKDGLYDAIYRDDKKLLQKYTLLNKASDIKLQTAIKELYREGSFIGDGGTAAAIVFEKATGLSVGKGGTTHLQKGREMIRHIEKRILRNRNLSESDRALAQQLVDDLKKAIGGYQ